MFRDRQAIRDLQIRVRSKQMCQEGRGSTEILIASFARNSAEHVSSPTATHLHYSSDSWAYNTRTDTLLIQFAIPGSEHVLGKASFTTSSYLMLPIWSAIFHGNSVSFRIFHMPVMLHVTENKLNVIFETLLENTSFDSSFGFHLRPSCNSYGRVPQIRCFGTF